MSEETNNEISNSNEIMNLSQSFDSKQYIRDIKSSVINGEVNALQAFTVLKRMAKISEELTKDKDIKQLALDEFDKHPGKSLEAWSAKIIRAATYTYFDFSECNHPQLNELYDIQKRVEADIKNLEEELKLLIPKETTQIGLGIVSDSKDIVIKQMPSYGYVEHEDQVTVNAPKKIQQIGLKFMKV